MNISGKTRLLGLLGWPVEHSFSPAMHNAAAAALGLDLVYVPLPTRPGTLQQAVRGLAALGFLGANVTVPHKQAVLAFLDEIDPAGAAIGAVNTIKVISDQSSVTSDQSAFRIPHSPFKLVGYNTDAAGFMADLKDLGVVVTGDECVILGAGGAARAVAVGLAEVAGRVHVVARRPAQAEALVADLAPHTRPGRLQAHPWQALAGVLAETPTLIVNATPVGMHPYDDDSPWPEKVPFPAGAFVYDLVYNPQDTKLMQQARAAGCRAANGLGMLIQQGALAFALWTGARPDLAIMSQNAISAL